MKIDGASRPLRSSCLLGGKLRLGTRLSCRKQWASAFFEPFSFGAFGLLGRPPHSDVESSTSERVPTPPSRFPLRGQGGLWDEEGSGGSSGARKRTADVGVGWSPAGPDSESKHPWGGRGGGPQGSGPSAAVRRLAPEERAVGGIS